MCPLLNNEDKIWLLLSQRIHNNSTLLNYLYTQKLKPKDIIDKRLDFFKEFLNDYEKFKQSKSIRNSFFIEKNNDISFLNIYSKDYPKLLGQLFDPPCLLYLRGNPAVLKNKKTIGIVGARKCTREAEDFAFEFAFELSKKGFCIVSGMAFGIDASAHLGALKSNGETIAVLGSGVDSIYPPSNKYLYAQLLKDNLLLSEYPIGMPALPYHFPRRNRIISGLSKSIIIIEASLRSGSLITARMALEQNRDVFVVKWDKKRKENEGNFKLLDEGAISIETVTDIKI
ncbi:MAG: DNA-processing protein DprA [Pseudomonadota bacterium]